MKPFFAVFVVVAVFVVTRGLEADTRELTKFDEVFREEYCELQNAIAKGECSSRRCNKNNTKAIRIGCAEARCSGKTVGFKGDPTKPYPDCCSVPICEGPSVE